MSSYAALHGDREGVRHRTSSQDSYDDTPAATRAPVAPQRAARTVACCGSQYRVSVLSRNLAIAAVVIALVVTLVILYVHDSQSQDGTNPMTPSQRACMVFCHGPLLHAVQMSFIFNDSKTFVDMPLRIDPEDALDQFAALGPNPSKAVLAKFVNETFLPVGSDVLPWTPTDFTPNPPLLSHIANASVAAWAEDVNELWLVLGRKVAPDVFANPQRHTLLPLPKPTIVPGGRFRETYYWDTYWIVKGLIACGMDTTAKYLIINLLAEASINGYVPNGARAYYLQRSQPPVLTLIVHEYYVATGDLDIVKQAMPQLQIAHEWWMLQGPNGRAVQIPNPQNPARPYVLNRYVGTVAEPRPESYTEDIHTATVAGYIDNTTERGELFRQLRGCAETGWDFSSRWFKNHETLESAWTSNVVAADLNAILYKVEVHMAEFYSMLGNTTFATMYADMAQSRREAVRALLWNETQHQWFDYYLSEGRQTTEVTAANFVGLWANLFDPDDAEQASILATLKASPLVHMGGIATTTLETGQQWDFPNAWAPLQHMVIMGLRNMTTAGADCFAKELSRRWLFTNYAAYNECGRSALHPGCGHYMFEKYNAVSPGHGGAGGEYVPQVGFGWTNGVALDLLRKYGDQFTNLDPPATPACT